MCCAVLFYFTGEDSTTEYSGRHNRFENCVFRNTVENVIDFFYYSLESVCDSNTFVNCVIDSSNYLFNCDRSNRENRLTNCIVTNVENYSRTANHQDSTYPLNIIIEYSDFYNNGFTAPSGDSVYTFNPRYADATVYNYHLLPASPCIDAGTNNNAPDYDKENSYRPLLKNVDLGIYEFGKFWEGFYNSDWHTAANWSDSLVPAAVDSITIPPPQFYFNHPEINSNAQIKKLFLQENSKVDIKNNASFDIL